MAFFQNFRRAQEFLGTAAEYDQVNYGAYLYSHDFVLNADNTVTVSRNNFGTDTLTSIEGIWFGREQAWYPMEDIVGVIGNDGVLTGNGRDNGFMGNELDNTFYGGMGNDSFDGNGGANDLVNFDGELIEYTITQGDNGSVMMSHPTWGLDTLTDVDSVFFVREATEYSLIDAMALTEGLPVFRLDADGVLNGTPARDIMRGTNSPDQFYGGTGNDVFQGRQGFDQVNFDGALTDYMVTMSSNGAFIFDHPVWGRDVLRGIEGIWMGGEGMWYPVVAATFGL